MRIPYDIYVRELKRKKTNSVLVRYDNDDDGVHKNLQDRPWNYCFFLPDLLHWRFVHDNSIILLGLGVRSPLRHGHW